MKFLVSPPRSGHHLFVRAISSQLGDANFYCEGYNCQNGLGEKPKDCERVPDGKGLSKCMKFGGAQLIKSHDFDLSLSARGRDCVVLVRDPLESLYSWFDLQSRKYRESASPENHMDFLMRKVDYLNGFWEKWVFSEQGNLVFSYGGLSQNLYGNVKQTIDFLGLEGKGKTIIQKPIFKEKRNLQNHPYFNPSLNEQVLDKLHSKILPTIRLLDSKS